MQTRPIPAVKFLRQIGAIKNAKEFWQCFKTEAIQKKAPQKEKCSTFVVISYEAIPNSTIVYKIIRKDLVYIQWLTTIFIASYLMQNTAFSINGSIPGKKIKQLNDEDFNNQYKDYRGPMIILVPPDPSEFTLHKEKLDPMYVKHKMEQLRRAMERLRDNCPHACCLPLPDSPHMHICDYCERIIHTRELP